MRLIDADVVLKVVKAYQDFPYGKLDITEQINKIPTAYNVDEVVEQLEELAQNEYDREGECGYGFVDGVQIYNDGVSQGKYAAYRKAIEIVEKGGME